jgi:ABC-2 type transport system permease protein
LTRKELLAVLKDPRTRMSLLIPPVVQALIFGYAATYDLNHVPYAVLDQDHSAASRQLLAGLDGSGVFERVADLHRAAISQVIDRRGARCWSCRSTRISNGAALRQRAPTCR